MLSFMLTYISWWNQKECCAEGLKISYLGPWCTERLMLANVPKNSRNFSFLKLSSSYFFPMDSYTINFLSFYVSNPSDGILQYLDTNANREKVLGKYFEQNSHDDLFK